MANIPKRDYTNPELYKIYEHRALGPQYQKMVHQVNLRIDKLHKLSNQDGYQGVTKWSMAKMQYEARLHGYLTGTGRISSKIPKTEVEMRKRIKEMQRFLTSKTSTKTGINEIYQKRADTINEKYGTNFTWQDLGKYFESGTAEKNDMEYGSKTALQALGKIQKNSDTIKEQIKSHSKKTIVVEDSELQNVVNKLLKDKALTRLGLY